MPGEGELVELRQVSPVFTQLPVEARVEGPSHGNALHFAPQYQGQKPGTNPKCVRELDWQGGANGRQRGVEDHTKCK